MVNTQLLEDKISTSGLKVGFLCENMGISRQAFDQKRKGNIKFRTAEIYVLSDLLKISTEEKSDIFFG